MTTVPNDHTPATDVEHADDCTTCRPIAHPEWCIDDHTEDDPADPVDSLVLHRGDQHGVDVTTRELLDAHKLDIRVVRTDCPAEGRTGKPALYVTVEAELTTWEQAAELARTILDSFGYLEGADRD